MYKYDKGSECGELQMTIMCNSLYIKDIFTVKEIHAEISAEELTSNKENKVPLTL